MTETNGQRYKIATWVLSAILTIVLGGFGYMHTSATERIDDNVQELKKHSAHISQLQSEIAVLKSQGRDLMKRQDETILMLQNLDGKLDAFRTEIMHYVKP